MPAAAPVELEARVATPKAKAFKSYVARSGEESKAEVVYRRCRRPVPRPHVHSHRMRRLMGKDKPTYTSHIDTGDFVIVINSAKVYVHPNKMDSKNLPQVVRLSRRLARPHAG